MKKFSTIIFVFAMLLFLVAYDSNTTTTNIDIDVNNTTLSSKAEVEDLVEIDIFSDIQIIYDGWNEFGKITKIMIDNCESLICKNVNFFATDYQKLTNGDIVTITAEYDKSVFIENGFKVINNTKEFQVEGFRQIVTA